MRIGARYILTLSSILLLASCGVHRSFGSSSSKILETQSESLVTSELTNELTSTIEEESLNQSSEEFVISTISKSIDVDDSLSIRFNERLDDQYVFNRELGFELDVENSKDISVIENCLIISEKGSFSFTVSEALKSIELITNSEPIQNTVKIGLINKHGIKAFFDPVYDACSISLAYKDTLTANHIIIETSSNIEIKEIKVVMK